MNIELLLLLLLGCSWSMATVMKTYSVIDLTENTPVNTLVRQLEEGLKMKMNMLNVNGYETELFSLRNGSIYTSSQIDREDLLKKRRCSDELYCLVELQVIIDDGRIYLIIPIHVVE
jgi:hypothetical protein